MHLHDHAGIDSLASQPFVHRQHGQPDDVRRGALPRRIDRAALRVLAPLFLPRSDIIELDMTVEDAAKLVISAGLVYPADLDGAPTGAITLPTRQRANEG